MSLGGRVPSAAALLQLDDDSEMSDAADARPTTAGSSAQEGIDLTADTPHPPKRAKAHKRARDESPGEPTQKAKKSNRSQPQTKSDLIDLADSDQESAGHVAASPRPVKLQRTAPPSVVPGAALSAVSGSTSSAVAAPAPSASHPPEDASDSDVDLVGLGRELGMDLVSPARVPAPVASGLGFETMAGTDGPPTTGKGKHEKKAARRYFDGEDISTKCYNCGKVGHISTECTNATVFKPCWLCGLRGHPAFRCTRELCFRCMKEGHQSRDCTNPKVFIKCCFWCGSSQHAHTECQAKGGSVDLTGIRCYVCGERGHLNCAISSAAPTTINTVSCSNCGLTGHSAQACTEERMPMNLTVDNWGNVQGENGTPGKNNRTPRKDWKADMECFYCNEKGHMKMDCPKKQADFERFGAGSGGYNRRPSFGAGNGITSQHRGPAAQDRRYSDHQANFNNRPTAGYSTPFSRDAARSRERDNRGARDRASSAHHGGGGSRDRDRDLLDRSHDRRSSSGGGGGGGREDRSRNDREYEREGRSRERTNDHRDRSRDARSAPPPPKRR